MLVGRSVRIIAALAVGLTGAILYAATVVPTDIQQPGTQPAEVGNLETPDKCDNCHGGFNKASEPAFTWRGSMMANAGRDPIFWATVAIAEQDFPGSGDLCIRCHSTAGWQAGRSVPTDGSGLTAADADGVDCDTCHKMTNPDASELSGVMVAPFIANDEQTPATGYFGSGMLVLSGGAAKLGPYSNAEARHQFTKSNFHRSVDFCGSCHDVSNPAVGDLAPNHGAQVPLEAGKFSGVPGAPVNGKAAFNNFPYQYGVVERTYSEYKAGLLSQTAVSAYPTLPADLKGGAIKAAYERGATYEDGTTRYFSCQTCHMKATTGVGCNKAGTPTRTDLAVHDLTGGNYWAPDTILYQNSAGQLRLGGGLTATQIEAIQAGKTRAQEQLRLAASLGVTGDTVKVTNLTGHKLISGYPEGRRMWLNIKWYDAADVLVREDGRYGALEVMIDGSAATIETLLDLDDPNTRIYEAHYAMTQEWASALLSLGYPASLPLTFDRVTGAVTGTLGQLAAQSPGTHLETFHFVINNTIVKDNRIPPYGMSYDEARRRNALPVPSSQYGSPGAGGRYNHWDNVSLNPPAAAVRASISLMYQPTSWEYIQFLYRANDGSNVFLGNEGTNLLETWRNTGMAAPYEMATASWMRTSPPPLTAPASVTATAIGTTQVDVTWSAVAAAEQYEVWRSHGGFPFSLIATPSGTAHSDTSVAGGTTYIYRVVAVDGSGNHSDQSVPDAATTIVFGDDPIVAHSTMIKASHITQIRSGVNAMRLAAGLGDVSYTDPSLTAGTPIKAVHITELRAALSAARSSIGLVPIDYTDPALVAGSTPAKGVHFQQLRDGCK